MGCRRHRSRLAAFFPPAALQEKLVAFVCACYLRTGFGLAGCTDVAHRCEDVRRWATFFHVFGVNPLFIYVLAALGAQLFAVCKLNVGGDFLPVSGFIVKVCLLPITDLYVRSLFYALFFVGLNWLAGYWLMSTKSLSKFSKKIPPVSCSYGKRGRIVNLRLAVCRSYFTVALVTYLCIFIGWQLRLHRNSVLG